MNQTQSATSGSFVYPSTSGTIPASTSAEMDALVHGLHSHKDKWTGESIENRLGYLERMIHDFSALADRWVDQVTSAERIEGDDFAIGIECMAGPYSVLRNLQGLKSALLDIQVAGAPKIPGPVVARTNGQVSAQVFPQTVYDRILFGGYRVEVWMEPDIRLEDLPKTQALSYSHPTSSGKVALVLGAGNLPGIPVTDVLDKLFVQNQVVLLKMNPVNDYIGPLLKAGFRCLIEAGYMQIAYGGASEGAYLCQHPDVDEIFITGSDKTFDAIVFGAGEVGARRKAEHQPLLKKNVNGELGNVTPVIVVPGKWSQEDLDYQAESVVSWIATHASCACNTPRVIILHAEWPQRAAFMDALRRVYSLTPLRFAYYPGSQQRHQSYLDTHSGVEKIGEPKEGELPWTIITDVNIQNRAEPCFTTEAFCSVVSVATISAASIPEYLEHAVAFANEGLWGTLAAGISIHPISMKEPQVKAAVEKAIEQLRYGTIGINCSAGLSWVLMTTPWGAFPGSSIYDIQSGDSFVHNTLMFSKPQKTVMYAKFRETPKPIGFVSRKKVLRRLSPLLVDLMAQPNLWKLPRILRTALAKA
ncbi:MAG: aldehyde dehydrogenase family protein [Chloroflexi bacterium]|nr:aldehyde dehydrogenase family protein [Chloroflexota bacterium]